MSGGHRWARWLGPPIVIGAVALVLSQLHAGADAGGRTTPPPVGACAASPLPTDAAGRPRPDVGPGSWWTLGERLDAHGAMAGRHLAVGRGGATTFAMDLPIESIASGPVGGVVILATDGEQRSEIRLVSVAGACSWLVDTTGDVVRGAILDPLDGSVLAHLVSRATRADLGTWRFGGQGAAAIDAPQLVAPALDAGLLEGPAWVTDLRLDSTSRLLAVQSCTDSGCLTRIFDLQARATTPAILRGAAADVAQGAMLGFANGKLLTWAACPGYPCAIQAWDLATGTSSIILDRADGAAVTRDGRFLVASSDSRAGRTLRLDLISGKTVLAKGVRAGERLLASGVAATSGVQLGVDEVAIGAPGATPHSFRPVAAEVIP
ncbi:MAG TPA: hypothetical protein VE011_01190 [Candidatus Dormibacteraeota bacterium]|nr:hypothetical protein [Candidatus Dormibacteraeota bacterium]